MVSVPPPRRFNPTWLSKRSHTVKRFHSNGGRLCGWDPVWCVGIPFARKNLECVVVSRTQVIDWSVSLDVVEQTFSHGQAILIRRRRTRFGSRVLSFISQESVCVWKLRLWSTTFFFSSSHLPECNIHLRKAPHTVKQFPSSGQTLGNRSGRSKVVTGQCPAAPFFLNLTRLSKRSHAVKRFQSDGERLCGLDTVCCHPSCSNKFVND